MAAAIVLFCEHLDINKVLGGYRCIRTECAAVKAADLEVVVSQVVDNAHAAGEHGLNVPDMVAVVIDAFHEVANG